MDRIERIKQMSAYELALLGVQDFAYIKQVIVDGASGYAIHAADGTQIALLPSRDVAFATVRQHDLEPVSVH
jgi:hypothetical protein